MTKFLLFLLITIFSISNINQTLSTQSINHNSLILGLTHSKLSLPKPTNSLKPSFLSPSFSSSSKVARQPPLNDLMEPLSEIRDGYLISLNIGTPPHVIQVYMDTGSDLTWVPCGGYPLFECIECDHYFKPNHNSNFSPFSSSSLVIDSCSSSFCVDVHASDNSFDPCTISGCLLSTLLKGTCSRPCPSFAYTYGGGGVITGLLVRDTLRVHGSSDSKNQTEIPKFCFGCVGSAYREPIGIVGFGKGKLSFLSQLGFLQKGFSHCFLPFKFANNPNISSPLIIGDAALSLKGSFGNLQFTPMLKSSIYPNHYYIGLESITLGYINRSENTIIPSTLKEFDSKGNGGMLIDSGTTYTHLPAPFYSQLLSVLRSMITFPEAPETEERTGFDLCYRVPCPDNDCKSFMDNDDANMFPSITFHFLNNASLVLPRGNNFYAMGPPSNSTVVKCLLFQSMITGDDDDGPGAVFGNFQQQNVEVVYDLQNQRIGFQAIDCVSVAISQGLHRKT